MIYVYIIYGALLVFFLVMCALVFRHTVMYSYLSPRFKTVIIIFGIIALCIIVFSLYLVIQLATGGQGVEMPSIGGGGGINF